MSQMALFKKRRFFPLFITQFFGAFNDNFFKNALVILVTFQSATIMGLGPSEIVALAGGVFILPFFLFSALAGQIADKYEKALVIRWIKFAEIGIMLLATAGFIFGNFPILLFILFLMGLHSTFFGPIKYSILPQHLSQTEIVGGNALIEAGTFLAILLGTIAGGVLIDLGSGSFIVSLGLIACAGFGFTSSFFIPQAAAVAPDLKLQLNPVFPTIEIIGFAKQTRSVFLSILGISWFWFFGAALLSLFAPLCKDVLHSNERLVTIFLSVFSVGTAAGSLLCEKLSRRRLEIGLVPLGSIGISVFAALLGYFCHEQSLHTETVDAWTFSLHGLGPWILATLFLLSMFSGFFIVPMYTLMQERSEARLRSRVIAANNIINALFMVVSSLMLIVFIHFGMSAPTIIVVLAVMNAAVAVYIYSLLPEFLLRFLAWCLSRLFYRVEMKGYENLPQEGGAVLICNHISFIDWLIIGSTIPRPVRFVMDHSFFKGFLIKRIMRGAKVIPIASAKEDPLRLEQAFTAIAEELCEGELVCIFPEGRITKDGKLNVFKPGILKIIGQTPVPIVPMGLNGLWGSLFSRKDSGLSKRPRKLWSTIELNIGKAIAPESANIDKLYATVEELVENF